MGTVWISGAERLGDGVIGGDMDTPGKPPRAVWHSTESSAGDAAFNAVAKVLIANADEPHILYDPTTDRLGQFGPLNKSARALRNDGATRTNRTGKVCIQIEVLARAGTPFTGYWKPGKNFRALMAAIRSWGVPDVFPLPLAGAYGDGVRTRSVWLDTPGHYGHCNVPGNDHWDPGKISPAKLFAAAPVASPAPTVSYVPFPGAGWFKRGRKSPIVLAMRKRLIAVGCNRYKSSSNPDTIGQGDIDSYEAWQRKCGYTGAAAEWPPGKTTWDKLKVPKS
jgi:hypothetical protein